MPNSSWITSHLTPHQRTQAATILRNAKSHLIEHGWIQGRNKDDHGRFCVTGAMWVANPCPQPCPWEFDCPVILAQCALGKYVGSSVIGWNDALGRTWEEVHTALEDCAAWLEELAQPA